jgi:hypothetical protein
MKPLPRTPSAKGSGPPQTRGACSRASRGSCRALIHLREGERENAQGGEASRLAPTGNSTCHSIQPSQQPTRKVWPLLRLHGSILQVCTLRLKEKRNFPRTLSRGWKWQSWNLNSGQSDLGTPWKIPAESYLCEQPTGAREGQGEVAHLLVSRLCSTRKEADRAAGLARGSTRVLQTGRDKWSSHLLPELGSSTATALLFMQSNPLTQVYPASCFADCTRTRPGLPWACLAFLMALLGVAKRNSLTKLVPPTKKTQKTKKPYRVLSQCSWEIKPADTQARCLGSDPRPILVQLCGPGQVT